MIKISKKKKDRTIDLLGIPSFYFVRKQKGIVEIISSITMTSI